MRHTVLGMVFAFCLLGLGQSADAEPKPKKIKTPPRLQKPKTKAPQRVYDDYVRSLTEFQKNAKDYQRDVARIVTQQVKRREAFIMRSYKRLIGKIEVQEHARRLEAINYFRRFLAKYSNHPRYTPDAMFRLAELEFEKSYVEYYLKLDLYDKQLAKYEKGRIPSKPTEPKEDYGPSIRLYQQLIARYGPTTPKPYRHLDGAYYLMGYCLIQMGKEKDARNAFATLIAKTPKSKFVPESWLRIGEYHFDYNELAKAIAGYAQVLKYKKSHFYDKALYKLAWTYYRKDDYPNAIEKFKELLRFADKKKAETGKFGSELRNEALEYLAVSCVEEDWNGDGVPDPDAGVDRCLKFFTGKEPFERDVFEAYAELLFTQAKYKLAIRVYKILMGWDPLNEKNVRYQSTIITAYDRIPDPKNAAKERVLLATQFGKNSKWYEHNKDKIATIQASLALVEKSLMESALFHHERAQTLKSKGKTLNKPELLQESMREYELAAKAYGVYLAKFPNSAKFYQISYFYAEALFWSGRYKQAAIQYGRVRDFPSAKPTYLERSAFNAIKAWELHIKRQVQKGGMPKIAMISHDEEPPKQTKKKKGRKRKVKPKPIPQDVRRWIEASDKYVTVREKLKNKTKVPQIAYNAAVMHYRFKHYDEARKRFLKLIDMFPKDVVAAYAATNIMNMFRDTGEWDKIQKFAKLFERKKIGSAKERKKIQEQIRLFKIGSLFKKAEKFFEKKDYRNAAKEYERLVTENPKNKFIDRALFNAALSYEKIRQWDKANEMYKRLIVHPRVKDSNKLKKQALFNLAENTKKFFDFKQAVENFRTFYQKYPSDDDKSHYALFQTGQMMESLGRYDDAARIYLSFTDKFKGTSRDKNAEEALFRAGQLYYKLKNFSQWSVTFKRYIREYGREKNHKRVLFMLDKFAEYYRQRRDKRASKRYYEQILAEYKKRGVTAGSDAAQYAAKSKFLLIEFKFAVYKGIILTGTLGNQKKQIKRKKEMLKKLLEAYVDVFPFKNVTWTLAAYFRIGNLFQVFAEMMYKAPIPKRFTQEEKDNYQTQLEDAAIQFEDTAVKRYEKAIAAARRFKVVNIWTKKTLESLNKYKPSKYRLFKDEKKTFVKDSLFHLPQL